MIVVGNKSKEYFAEAERLRNLFVKRASAGRRQQARVEDRLVLQEDRHALAGRQAACRTVVERAGQDHRLPHVWLVENPDAKEWVWKERKLPHE